MIIITRNGQTTVYTGWRAWLVGAVITAAIWLVLALLAFVWIGFALTLGVILLLAIPAVAVVALLNSMSRR
jgi:hypothetical protein